MIATAHEDKIWSLCWIIVGIPAMIAGLIMGYRHDDPAMMIGAVVVAFIILLVNIPALKK